MKECATCSTESHLIDEPPLQDVDLLQRLNQYFDTLDLRLRQGQGWVIYNASGNRASRITQFMQEQLSAGGDPVQPLLPAVAGFRADFIPRAGRDARSPERQEIAFATIARRVCDRDQRVSRQTLARHGHCRPADPERTAPAARV